MNGSRKERDEWRFHVLFFRPDGGRKRRARCCLFLYFDTCHQSYYGMGRRRKELLKRDWGGVLHYSDDEGGEWVW